MTPTIWTPPLPHIWLPKPVKPVAPSRRLWAAVGRVQGVAATASTSTSIATAYTNNVTQGSLLICAIRGGTTTSTFSVSDNNGNTWHDAIGGAFTDGGSDDVDIWFAANANAGATTVTVTITQTGTHTTRYVIEEYSGVATSNPQDATGLNAPATGTSNTTTTSTTLAQANELSVYAVETGTAGTYTKDSNYTLGTVDAAGPNTRIATQWRQTGAAGSTESATWSFGSSASAGVIATFKPTDFPDAFQQYQHQVRVVA